MALNPSRLSHVPTRPAVVEAVDILTQMCPEHIGRIVEQDYPKWARRLIHLERVRRKAVHEVWDPKLGAYTVMTLPASNSWKKRSIATGMRYAEPGYMHHDMSTMFPAKGSKYICRVVEAHFVQYQLDEAATKYTLSYDRNFGEAVCGRACIEKLFIRGVGTCASCDLNASWASDKICVELWFWFASPEEVLRRYRYRVYMCTLKCTNCGLHARTSIDLDDFCNKAIGAFDRWTERLAAYGWRN